MNKSIWRSEASAPHFKSLDGDVKTQVLIIGGGMAGILCAHMLKQAGVDYLLVEQTDICGKVTKNTTAKITSQHGLIYQKLICRFGVEYARLYLQANEDALEEYRRMCRTIDCGFEEKDNYVYSLSDAESLEKELRAFQKIGSPAEYVKELDLPFNTVGAVKLKNQAQFNPLEFAFSVAEGLNIREHTKVLELGKNCIITNHGKIKADKIIVTTHFPLLNKHGGYSLKLYQHRSYVVALENAQNVDGMYIDASEKGLSFRNYNDLLLLGGGSHKTGKHGGNWRVLETFAKKHYPKSRIIARWAAQDCMTLDGVPYIGQYSKSTPNLYVATGFNKWGMSSSMAAAKLLCRLVTGKISPYEQLFSPSRSILHPQLFVNAASAAANLLTPTVPRCPHLGCALKYNPDEHSWDCPCHGSRFDTKGGLLNGPATDDKAGLKGKRPR